VTEAEDRRDSLIAAYQQLESKMPDLQAEVVESENDCERIISAIFAPIVQELVAKARAITAQLDPLKAALLTFLNSDRAPPMSPTDAGEFLAYVKQRKPLEDAKAAAQEFFDDTREFSLPDVTAWSAARRMLRETPFTDISGLSGV